MIKLPLYTFQNYTDIISSNYDNTINQMDLSVYLNILSDSFIDKYKNTDTTKIGDFIKQNSSSLQQSVSVGNDNFMKLEDLLIGCKLALPTLWTCDYFFRNIGKGTHHGIDIILPKGTPLPAFESGEIISVRTRDGKTLNDGNCIVIKSDFKFENENVFICYEHLDTVGVKLGQKVKKGDTVGTCGKTGNATQYHLHLQFDRSSAPYHPYYSNAKSIAEIQKYTFDPVKVLKSIYNISSSQVIAENPATPIFDDLPTDNTYKNSVQELYKKGLIKGFNGKIYPDAAMKRIDFIVMLYRIVKNYSLLKGTAGTVKKFTDVNYADKEIVEALKYLTQYGVVKGTGDKFYPDNSLTGEEIMAFLGRIFYSTKDSSTGLRYQSYLDKFISLGIISKNYEYIGKPVLRKEVFRLVSILIE